MVLSEQTFLKYINNEFHGVLTKHGVMITILYAQIKILMCYVFPVVSFYGCGTWTYSKATDNKINAYEMWCYVYRRLLRISWTSHTTNIDVLQKNGVKETTMLNNLNNTVYYIRLFVVHFKKVNDSHNHNTKSGNLRPAGQIRPMKA